MPQDRFDYIAKGYFDPNPDQKQRPKAQSGGLLSGLRSQLSDVESKLSNVRIDPTGLDAQYRMEEARRLDRQRVNTENRIAQVEKTGQDFAPTAPVRDTVSSAGRGLSAATIGFGGNLVGLTTQEFDNPLSRADSAIQEWLDSNLTSEGLKQRRKIAEERIAEAAQNGMGDEFLETLRQYGSDGALTADLIISQIPNLIGPAAVGRGLAKGAIKSGVKKGASEAVVRAAAEKAAARGAVGTASLMQGGSVANETYDRLMADTSGIWEMDEKFTQMVEAGASPEEAKQQRAGEISQRVGLAATALSVITQKYFPTAEKALAGSSVGKNRLARAGATALGETGSEMIEEGGGRLIQNVGVRSIDKGASLTEGVGSSAALGAIGAGPIGAGAGALSSAPNVPETDIRTDYGRLGEALDTVRTGPTAPEVSPALPAPANYDRTFSVDGLSMKGSDVMRFAEANRSDPRIARVLDQNVSEDTKLEQVARVMNEATAQRTMADVVSTLSPLADGKTKASEVRTALSARMESIPTEVADANPALARLKELSDQGNAQPKDIRAALQMFSPQQDVGTIFARPERGGDGSVLMKQEQKSGEAQREREAEKTIRLMEARQRRYDQATANQTQREDLRPGASEPEAQVFLADNHPTNPGAPASVVASERPGYARVQYESDEIVGGRPVIVSEEVPIEALMSRVVRGSVRLMQDTASRQRRVPTGVGTEMEGPRNSIDRASTKQVTPVPQPGTDIQPVITPTERMPPSDVQVTPNAPQSGGQGRVGQTEQRRVTDQTEEQPQKNLPRAAEQRPRVTAEKRGAVEYQPGVDEGQPISVDRAGEATVRDSKTSPPGRTETEAQPKPGPKWYRTEGDNAAAEEVRAKTYRDSLEKAGGREPKAEEPKAEDSDPFGGAFSRRSAKQKSEPAPSVAMTEEEAITEIKTALERLAGKGQAGRIAANRIRSLLKDGSYNNRQVLAAFVAADAVSSVLKGKTGIDVAFVPTMTDKDGVQAQGQFRAYDVSRDGMKGIIELSLNPDWAGAAMQTGAHEAFHVIQRLLRSYDPQTFAALNRSFKDGMTVQDIHPSLRRALKAVKYPDGRTYWDVMTTEFGDQTWSGYGSDPNTITELQAYVFGYLHDAQRFGLQRKGLAVQFDKALSFFTDVFEAIGNAIRGMGFTSTAQLFSDASEGNLGRDGELMGGEQFSRRKPFERPKISDTKIRVPIPETSIIPFLYDDGTPSPKLPTEKMNGAQAAKFLNDRAQVGLRRVFGVDKITASAPETDRYLAKTIAAEAKAAILKEQKTGLRSALDWYTTAVENAITAAADVFPMLGSDAEAVRLSNSHGIRNKKDARTIFTMAMSITSQNMKVRDNARAAVEQVDYFLENRRFDPSRRYGTKAPSISSNLRLANTMLGDVFQGDVSAFGEFLDKEFTVGELNAYSRQIQQELNLKQPPFKVGGELVNERVYGSAIFGPKIGNGFYQNLNGNFAPVTIDLWFMRLWGRMTGTLVGNDAALSLQATKLRDAVKADDHLTYKVPDGYAEEIEEATDEELVDIAASLFKVWDRTYKSLRAQGVSNEEIASRKLKPQWAFAAARLESQKKANDAPTGGSQRKWIRSVVNDALRILKREGYDLTAADLQAIVWYPEKDIHSLITKGRLEASLNVSYDTAIEEIASQRNVNAANPNDSAGRYNDDQRRGTGSGQADSGGPASGARSEDAGQGAQFSRRSLPTEASQAGGLRDGRGLRGGTGLLQAPDAAPLQGLPRKVKVPATGQVIQAGPYLDAREAAAEYMRQAGLPYDPPRTYAKVDVERAQRIAAAYEAMPHDPSDPEVRASYEAMAQETLEQWRVIKDVVGLEVDFITGDNPYEASPRLAIEDVVQNNHMWVFPTDSGYGQSGITPEDEAENPLLAMAGEVISGQEARINDIFRIVHDFFGHAKEGVGFRADGEENAWRQHVAMYSPLARNAATVETRGQNSWLNYGPYGEANRTAKTEDTVFAEQKIGKLPQWVVDEAAGDDAGDDSVEMQTGEVQPVQFSRRTKPPPERTVTAYKLFRVRANSPGQLFPLFVNANEPVPMGEWLDADEGPSAGATKTGRPQVKSSLGNLAYRPGWHAGDLPVATHIGAGGVKPTTRPANQVWAEVEFADDRDWQEEANARGTRNGRLVPKDAHITDQIPVDGYYRYKTNPNMTGEWLIGGSMKVNRVLSDDEVKAINDAKGVADLPRDKPFSPEDAGFSRRTVAPPSSIPLRSAPRFNDNNLNFGGQQVDTSPRAQTMDDIIYKLQDRYIDTKRVQQDIQKAGRTINERSDAYMAEELSSGRATSLSKNFLNRELNPLLQEMSQKGIKLADLDKFLHARHAVERNAQIRKINPAMNAGSGMTDADATSYLNGLAPLRRRQLEQLAARVDGMVQETQRLIVAGGLDTQDTINNWNRAYQNYVPLFREGFEDEEMSAGAGMSVRGGSSRRAMGSDRNVVNVLSNIAQQRERAISRAERNRVGNALIGLALENPNDSFWFVVDPKGSNKAESVRKLVDFGIDPMDAEAVFAPPQERYIDQSTGEVIHRPNRLFSMADNVMATRVNGEDRFIIFNPRNPQAKRMVEALKGAGNIEMMKMLSGVAKVTRYFAAINTQYNPAFGIYNLMRDLQGAALNLSSTPIVGKEAQVLRDSFPAMAGIYRELRQGRRGGTAQGQWESLAEEFEREGGKTGFRDLFANAEDRSKAIERELSKGPLTATMKTAGAAFDWLSDFNETIENGVRLAAYKAAKDAGLSNAKAASVAKNLTVNFNRRGAVGAEVGALYAFFNASVQGTARMAQTITGPAGRKIVAGGLLLGVAQAVMLGLAGLDDDIPEWVKDRNVIIPLGGGRYFAFPMPLGYHAIPAFSRRALEAFGNDDPIQRDVIGMAGVIMDAFNPIGSGGSLLQVVTPTVVDPLAALSENRDFAGRQIYQGNMNSLDPTPGPDRNRAGVSPVGAALSFAVDRLTGGSGYTPGAMSPTGDAIDYLIGQATGGVGREIMKVTSVGRSLVTSEEVPSYKIPVVGRMIGNANESFSVTSRYYENVTQMNRHEREIEGRDEDGKDTTPYLEKNPDALLYPDVANYESEIKSLRKAKKAAETQEERDLLDEEMLTLMMEVNQMVADAKRGG